jgi:hypothetical protein
MNGSTLQGIAAFVFLATVFLTGLAAFGAVP